MMRGDHHGLASALERNRRERERLLAQQGGHDSHTFELPVYGAGIVRNVRCAFNMLFVAETAPAFHAGGALHEGDTRSDLVQVRAHVNRWLRTAGGEYVGADVDVQVIGRPRQRSVVFLTFSGRCIRRPTPSIGSIKISDPI